MTLFCVECNENIASHCHRLSNKHKDKCCTEIEPEIKIVKTAYKNRLVTYRVSSNKNEYYTDVKLYLEELESKIVNLLKNSLSIHECVKVNMELYALFVLPSEEKHEIKSFNSRYKVISLNLDLDVIFNEFRQVLTVKSSEFLEKDSGWALSKILFLEININKCKSL